MVKIPGSELPDEWIVRGNHRDGWVNGAEDPLSGLIAQMEELRAYANLLKQGWKPKRTIVYAAWDGEEPGLLGSTELVETHAAELKQKVVAFLNSDTNGRGYLNMAGSHSLERFVNEVAKDVVDPETGLTVWKRLQLGTISQGPGKDRTEARARADLRIDALGSGSDFTPWLQHAGIASLNLGFGGEGGNGIYHSIYDNFEHFSRFNDTSYVYGVALAQTAGTAVMRLASAELLPFKFGNMADTYANYLDELKTLATTKRDEAVERNRELDEGVFAAIKDPRVVLVPPKRAEVAPFLNLTPIENGLAKLRQAAERYDAAAAKVRLSGGPLTEINRTLIQVEQALASETGLPRRPWYRHQIYAPGFYTGYGVKTMPGVREAIEQGSWKEADEQAVRIGERLEAAGRLIDQAAAALDR
jgi:N-acetylated-alpha-linked acidic dipeptidase